MGVPMKIISFAFFPDNAFESSSTLPAKKTECTRRKDGKKLTKKEKSIISMYFIEKKEKRNFIRVWTEREVKKISLSIFPFFFVTKIPSSLGNVQQWCHIFFYSRKSHVEREDFCQIWMSLSRDWNFYTWRSLKIVTKLWNSPRPFSRFLF